MAYSMIDPQWETPGAADNPNRKSKMILALRAAMKRDEQRRQTAAARNPVLGYGPAGGLGSMNYPASGADNARDYSEMLQGRSDIANLSGMLSGKPPMNVESEQHVLPQNMVPAGAVTGGLPAGVASVRGLAQAAKQRGVAGLEDFEEMFDRPTQAAPDTDEVAAEPQAAPAMMVGRREPTRTTTNVRGEMTVSPDAQRAIEQSMTEEAKQRNLAGRIGLGDILTERGYGAGPAMVREALYEPPVTLPEQPPLASVPRRGGVGSPGIDFVSEDWPKEAYGRAEAGYQGAAETKARSLADILRAGGGITPREEAELKQPAPPRDRIQLSDWFDPETGERSTTRVNLDTGQQLPVQGAEGMARGKPTAAEFQRKEEEKALAVQLNRLAGLSEQINIGGGPSSVIFGGIRSAIGAPTAIDVATREYKQIADAVALQLASRFNRGRPSDRDLEAARSLLPIPTDPESVRTNKLNLIYMALGNESIDSVIDPITGKEIVLRSVR